MSTENSKKSSSENLEQASDPIEKSTTSYVDGNSIFILGGFDDTISKNVVPNLVKLINQQKTLKNGKIDFYINSYGGYCSELFSLLSLISLAKSNGIKISTFNMGMAYSCASILAVVGDERKMFRCAKNLMHLGLSFSASSTFVQVDRNRKREKDHFNNIVSLYESHTKLTEKKIRELMSDNCCYLNSSECLRFGLVDEVCDC